MKKLIVIFIIIIFALFVTYIRLSQNTHKVLYIISPTEIVVDLNNNNRAEDDEHIMLDLSSFSTQNNNPEILKKLGLSQEDGIRLGYLAENYAKKILDNKKVEGKNGRIYTDFNYYDDLLYNSGLALHDKNEKLNDKIIQNLKSARKLNLVVLNNKNDKYH